MIKYHYTIMYMHNVLNTYFLDILKTIYTVILDYWDKFIVRIGLHRQPEYIHINVIIGLIMGLV